MATPSLDALFDRISDGGLLDDPVAEHGIVYGRASLDAAGSDVMVNVDPELDDEDEDEDQDAPDLDALIEGITRTLSMTELQWKAVIEAVVTEIEDAVADPAIAEQIDLRDDLEAKSIVVFADAVLLRFEAPRQFPESRILAQLDENCEVETVEVEANGES
ncbi:cytochrome C5 [Microbacterium sp. P06]|uniref:cytochrome C5 n=1 Tax=Microbacterium sp. P06 TaxID=3366949 RepID=UPI0037475D92